MSKFLCFNEYESSGAIGESLTDAWFKCKEVCNDEDITNVVFYKLGESLQCELQVTEKVLKETKVKQVLPK